ncbi:MAG TPA: LysM peptidoglycan-binding domain-containing protein [Anaerolineales bacterium]
MRQAKRLFYIILLNILISGITVIVVLQVWQRNHPPLPAENTPVVIIVTPTGAGASQNSNLPGTKPPTDTGVQVSGTIEVTPTPKMLVYQVKEGDSLGALAIQFNLSVEDLLIANDLSDPDSLYVGQIIYIPTAPLPKATETPTVSTVVASRTPRPSATPTFGPTMTSTATEAGQEPQLVIDTVIGAGDLDIEHVLLKRTGNGDLSLSGWRLEDGTGKEYHFPRLTLYKGGSINLYTRTGQDSVADLFWGLSSPVWRTGKIISLYDAQDQLRATYTVP